MDYKIEDDIPYESRKHGPRLSQFPLGQMEIGHSFVIPMRSRTIKGKTVSSPAEGFNVREANKLFFPKVFKKRRVFKGRPVAPGSDRVEPQDGVRVWRLEDAKSE